MLEVPMGRRTIVDFIAALLNQTPAQPPVGPGDLTSTERSHATPRAGARATPDESSTAIAEMEDGIRQIVLEQVNRSRERAIRDNAVAAALQEWPTEP